MQKPASNGVDHSSLTWRLTEGETLIIGEGLIKIRHLGNFRNRSQLKVTLPRNLNVKAVGADEPA